MTFLQRGRSAPTLQMAAPQGADMGNSHQVSFPQGGALGESIADFQAKLAGRVSLTLLSGMIIGAVVFYMWTRDAQGS